MTQTSWETIGAMLDDNTASEHKYLRLKDGEKAIVAFIGNPTARETIWINGKSEDYDPNNPTHTTSKEKPTVRVSIEVFNCTEKRKQTLEMGKKLFRDLCARREKYGLEDWTYEVSRRGTDKTNTEYSILPDNKITPELRAAISDVTGISF